MRRIVVPASLLGLLALVAGCSDRAVPTAWDGPARAKPDAAATTVDRGAPGRDGPPAAFCSGPARAEIGGVLQSSVGLGTGTASSVCCTGELIHFYTLGAKGKVKITLSIMRTHDAAAGVLKLDLAQPPKGWSFTIGCEPYARCGAISAATSTFSGALTLHPIPAPPAVGVWLCLEARPKVSGGTVQPVRLWSGPVKINTQCRFGQDQTCNHDPLVSALYGTCNANGTCTCGAGYVKDGASGRCKQP